MSTVWDAGSGHAETPRRGTSNRMNTDYPGKGPSPDLSYKNKRTKALDKARKAAFAKAAPKSAKKTTFTKGKKK